MFFGAAAIFLSTLAFGADADVRFRARAIEVRPGFFFQGAGWVASGGAFWAPEFLTRRFHRAGVVSLGARSGAWIVKDKTLTLAFSPSVELALGYRAPLGRMTFSLLGGGGYLPLAGRGYPELGFSLVKGISAAPLGISAVGAQYLWLRVMDSIHFLGAVVTWKW